MRGPLETPGTWDQGPPGLPIYRLYRPIAWIALTAYEIRGLLRPRYGYMPRLWKSTLLDAFARLCSGQYTFDCQRFVSSKGGRSRDCRHRLPVVPDVTVRLSREEVVTQVSDYTYRCVVQFDFSARLKVMIVNSRIFCWFTGCRR